MYFWRTIIIIGIRLSPKTECFFASSTALWLELDLFPLKNEHLLPIKELGFFYFFLVCGGCCCSQFGPRWDGLLSLMFPQAFCPVPQSLVAHLPTEAMGDNGSPCRGTQQPQTCTLKFSAGFWKSLWVSWQVGKVSVEDRGTIDFCLLANTSNSIMCCEMCVFLCSWLPSCPAETRWGENWVCRGSLGKIQNEKIREETVKTSPVGKGKC